MSRIPNAEQFVEDWIKDRIQKEQSGPLNGSKAWSSVCAKQCFAAAEEHGILKDDIELRFGDLALHIRSAAASLSNASFMHVLAKLP